MKTRTPHIVLLFVLLLWSAQALAQPTGPLGCWQSSDFTGHDLAVAPDGSYWHGEQSGQWLVEGSQIWLVNDDFVGTKWVFSVMEDELTLNRPEDFNYLGEGRYMYLQFTPADTVLGFQREESEQECGQRYADAIESAELRDEPTFLHLETETLGTVVVEVDATGNPNLCTPDSSLCTTLHPVDAAFSGELAPSGSSWSYLIWTIDEDTPSQLTRTEGSYCERDEDRCDFGVGYLLVFYDANGNAVSAKLDWTLERESFSERLLQANASMGVLWLTTGQDCGDNLVMCRRELFFGVYPPALGLSDNTTGVIGPYLTGVAEESTFVADDGSSTTCREWRRAHAVVEGERLITIIHSFDIDSETATSETFVSTDERFELVRSDTVPAPLLVRDCDPSP